MKQVYGLALCVALAIPAYLLGQYIDLVGAPIFAIILGICVAPLIRPKRELLSPGISFSAKFILQAAVVLLGFGLNLTVVARAGLSSLPVILSTIATALIVAYLLARALKIDRRIATLIGVGSSICGGSAIAATAPVISAKDEEIAQAISVIFFFNVLAALIFPSLGQLLHLSNAGFGLFAGTAVNDTSSVTATAAAWDSMHPGADTLSLATIVKLTRTLAIIPITLALSLIEARRHTNEEKSTRKIAALPRFIIFFLLASAFSTLVSLPAAALATTKFLSKFFITMAMAAIGLNTDIVKLLKSGTKPLILGASCWIAISIVSLCVQHLFALL